MTTKYFQITPEVRVVTEEMERFVVLREERLTEVHGRYNPEIIAFHEWKETNKVEIGKRQLLELCQSVDFNPVLS